MGTLYWQLNDCWPVTSWSAIDGYGRRKPLWYATRRVYADRLLTFQPRGEGLTLVAINDSDEPWHQRLTIERWTFDGGVVGAVTLGFEIAARGVLEHPVPTWVSQAGDGRRELIRARADDSEALWFFERDKALDYPNPSYDSVLRRQDGRSHFTVTAPGRCCATWSSTPTRSTPMPT